MNGTMSCAVLAISMMATLLATPVAARTTHPPVSGVSKIDERIARSWSNLPQGERERLATLVARYHQEKKFPWGALNTTTGEAIVLGLVGIGLGVAAMTVLSPMLGLAIMMLELGVVLASASHAAEGELGARLRTWRNAPQVLEAQTGEILNAPAPAPAPVESVQMLGVGQ